MNVRNDIDRRVADWLVEDAPGRAPDHLRNAIDRQLDRTPQHAGISRLPLPGRTLRSWFPAAAMIVTVIAATTAGLWVSGSQPPATRPLTMVAVLQPSGGAIFGDVATSGSGLVAVGTIGADGNHAAAAWTSADGVAWSSVPSVGTTGGSELGRLVRGAAAPVGIGLLCPGPAQPCEFARVTLSAGGSEWRAIQWVAATSTYGVPTIDGAGYGFGLNATATDGHTDVMVGWAASRQGPTPIGPAVATSTDRSLWTWRVLAGTQPSGSAMSGVASGDHGFVAVGTGPTVEPAIWVSVDGSSWQRLPAAGTQVTGELDDVAWGGGVYVAVGRDGANAAAWISEDARIWRRAPSAPSLDDGDMTRVTWTGAEFLAVGRTGAGDGAAWTSADGSSWTRLDTSGVFPRVPIVGGAVVGSRITLFGQDPVGQIQVAQQGG